MHMRNRAKQLCQNFHNKDVAMQSPCKREVFYCIFQSLAWRQSHYKVRTILIDSISNKARDAGMLEML